MTEPDDPIRPHPLSSPVPPGFGPPDPGAPHPTAQHPTAPHPAGQHPLPPYPGRPYPGPPPGAAPYAGPPPGGYQAPPPGMYGPPPGYPPGYPGYPAPPPVAPNGQALASFVDRLLAYLIDGLILGAVSVLLTVPLIVIISLTASSSLQVNDQGEVSNFGPFLVAFLGFYAGFIVLILAVSYVYLVEMMWRTGQTVGKRVMKIRIIPLQPGAPLTRGAAAKRWAIYQLVGGVVPGFNLLDGLWQLWDKPFQQCLHDKVAGTVVVKLVA